MKGLSRNNVAYDLRVSPFVSTVLYDNHKVEFYFSSQNNRNKFVSRLEAHRTQINNSLSKRFHFEIDASAVADMRLYATIEKRGFRVVTETGEILCPENLLIKFAGPTKMFPII